MELACRALAGHDGLAAVVESSGRIWRPDCQNHDSTENYNHFVNRREVVVEFLPSRKTVWGFRPQEAKDQERKLRLDNAWYVHSTAITNVNSIMAMGLQAGAGQK